MKNWKQREDWKEGITMYVLIMLAAKIVCVVLDLVFA